jgi:hypothetical protein
MLKPKVFLKMILLCFISGALAVSCEDVINVKLQDASSRLVVEGRISNISDSVKIMLHKSTDYFSPKNIVSVTNGTVSISDSQGNSYLLSNNLNGIYSVTNLTPKPGGSYTLNLTADGVSYTASTVMPYLVKIDSLIIDKNPERPKENRINIIFKDPYGIPNYYQVKVFKNDSLLNNHIALYSDKYIDGKAVIITINASRLNITRFEVNDTVKVQLINIDKMMYDYYQILRDITDEENFLSTSSPSNPPNNLDNGALGYFTALSVNEKTIIVK